MVQLVYVDDVIAAFIHLLLEGPPDIVPTAVGPEYTVSVGDLANKFAGSSIVETHGHRRSGDWADTCALLHIS